MYLSGVSKIFWGGEFNTLSINFGAGMTSEHGRLIRCWFPQDFPMGFYNGVFPIYELNNVCGKHKMTIL